MPGYSDYSAEGSLNWITGQLSMAAVGDRFLALFTTAPTSDDGTGGVEVSGAGYARVQVGGTAVTNGTTASGNAILHFAAVPAWLVAGMSIRNDTTPSSISAGTTISSLTGTTVTMSANAAGAGVGSGDTIRFSAWPAASASTGSEPSVSPVTLNNVAKITFAQATGTGAGFGTVQFFGLFDALTSGNYLMGDWLGGFNWRPVTMSSASPGVVTEPAHGYSAADPVVATIKYGGTLPTFSQSNLTGVLVVVSPATDTFTLTNGGTAVNTSSAGDFMMRKITQQSVPPGVTASFDVGTLPIYAA